MWILESSGDLFDGKKIWLRPGRSLLLGRTGHSGSSTERTHRIDFRGVSRKHLVIAVAPVSAGASTRVNVKSQLTVTDDSKVGTLLDGEKVAGASKILHNDKHEIRLGAYPQYFTITWRPIVLCFSHGAKALRTTLDPQRPRLEPIDVKAISDFIVDRTTHVVAVKRNLPKVLQALLNARHVVNDAYVDEIIKGAASPGVDEDGQTHLPSPFETDFDANWPDAMKFVPPPSNEPVPRPSEFFTPDSIRTTLFDGFTFVFSDPAQHGQLESTIALGGAKCPLFEMSLGKTTVEEFCSYVRDLAMKKGSTLHSAADLKGVVVVRFNSKTPQMEDWTKRFIEEVDAELEQRSIVQNEFLDAILTKDANVLRKGLLDEETEGITAPPSTALTNKAASQALRRTTSTLQQPEGAQPAPEAAQASEAPTPAEEEETRTLPAKRRPRWKDRRAPTASRFAGFDDFDPSQISKTPASPEPVLEKEPEAAPSARPQSQQAVSQSLFVEEDDPQPSNRATRKRPATSTQQEIDPASHVDSLLPGSRALKKRRVEQEAVAAKERSRSASASVAPEPQATTTATKGSKKVAPNADIRNATRANATAMDRKAARVHVLDNPDAALNGEDVPEPIEDIEEMRKLAIVEEMDMPERRSGNRRPQAQADAPNTNGAGDAEEGTSSGWNNAWNGRKNFKRFRRKGQGEVNRGPRLIVAVEVERRKDFGIGDSYWLEENSGSKKSRSQSQREREGGTQSQSQRVREESVLDLDEEDELEEAEGVARVANIVSGKAGKGKKRTAPVDAATQSSAKRPRHGGTVAATGRGRGRIPTAAEESSSEDDGMRFKLRKR